MTDSVNKKVVVCWDSGGWCLGICPGQAKIFCKTGDVFFLFFPDKSIVESKLSATRTFPGNSIRTVWWAAVFRPRLLVDCCGCPQPFSWSGVCEVVHQ